MDKKVSILTSFSKGLLPTLAIGADGMISGHGSIIADLQVDLWEAAQQGDLARARTVSDVIWPLAQACYAPPAADMHNRMKYLAKRMGRFPCDAVRPPLLPLSAQERLRLDAALEAARKKADLAHIPLGI